MARRTIRIPRLAAVSLVILVGAVVIALAGLAGSPGGTGSPLPVTSSTGAWVEAPSPGHGPPVLLAVGDIGRCDAGGDDETARLAASRPGDIVLLGDTAYPDGSPSQLRDCFGAAWAGLRNRIRFAVTGNHDVRTDRGAPLQAYLGAAAGTAGRPWASARIGAWQVVLLSLECNVLPGGCGPDSEQVAWLRDELARSDARCTLALWHEPRFSSGYHGNDDRAGVLWDALYAAGADLVLNGHDHDYERFAPQDPAGRPDPARGITQIVVGTGGGVPRPFESIVRNSEARVDGAYGLVEITLGEAGWTSQFLAVDGTATDRATGTCH